MRLSFATIAYGAILLVILAIACASTAGAATGRASYTALSFELTDLDLNDGIVASLTWTSAGAESLLRSTPSPGDPLTILNDSKPGIFASTDVNLGFAGARTLPDSAFSFASASSTVGLRAETRINQSFDLSPHTKVTFSAIGHAELSGTGAFSGKVASAGFVLSHPPNEFPSDFVALSGDGSSDKAMSASISNDTGGLLHYDFQAVTAVQLNGNLPVPEPGVLVLLVVGVFTAGAVARRPR